MPDDEDLAELLAARAGIHAPDAMPFGVPWTDGIQEPEAATRFLAHHWAGRAAISPEAWSLQLAAVVDGRLVDARSWRRRTSPAAAASSAGRG